MGRRKSSAGILLYRVRAEGLEVFLAHPGGPLWADKNDGHWGVPKGQRESGEAPFEAARRELQEETGIALPSGVAALPLGTVTQKSGKVVIAWAVEHPDDPGPIVSNIVRVEWPPGSGETRRVPEIDRAQFFTATEARRKIKDAQAPFIDRLEVALGLRPAPMATDA